jgi:hypothetical protein
VHAVEVGGAGYVGSGRRTALCGPSADLRALHLHGVDPEVNDGITTRRPFALAVSASAQLPSDLSGAKHFRRRHATWSDRRSARK